MLKNLLWRGIVNVGTTTIDSECVKISKLCHGITNVNNVILREKSDDMLAKLELCINYIGHIASNTLTSLCLNFKKVNLISRL